jgi:hypothetical protein
MYRRILTGIIERGQTGPFLAAMRESGRHQDERGIRARTTVWGSISGQTSGVLIASDFNSLEELEKFTEMVAKDSSFATLRREVRSKMVYDESEVSIHRLDYHSEGLISSEDATAPRRYMRTLDGDVAPGRKRDFIHSIAQALEFQKARGINATTSVWSAVTGATNGVSIVAEFDTFGELERFDQMAAEDREFARLRAATRESMVFLTSRVHLMRSLA